MKGSTATKLRFGVVGAANTLVDLVGYTALVLAGLPVFVANLLSTSAGMALSFTLNRSYTFRSDGGDVRRQLSLFVLVTAFGLWVLQPLVILATGAALDGPPDPAGVVAPKLAGLVVGFAWNYTLYSRVVFKRGDAAP
ncbi:GtrA family protein [Actinosynnema sp. NPDC004786]